MGVHLSKQMIESIKTFKYTTSGWTPLDHVFNPWWEFCVSCLPRVSQRCQIENSRFHAHI